MKRLILFLAIPALLLAQRRGARHVGEGIKIGDQNNILWTGIDSITVGYGTPAGYPALLVPSSPFSIYNTGVDGQRMATVATTGAYVDTLIAPWARYNVEAALGGANDILNGMSAADLYQIIKTWHLARRASGWRTIAWALPSLNGAAAYAKDAEAVREQFNALLVADHDFADQLIRVDLTPLGCDGCWATSGLFQNDGIHPTAAGQALLAQLLTKALDRITGGGNVSR